MLTRRAIASQIGVLAVLAVMATAISVSHRPTIHDPMHGSHAHAAIITTGPGAGQPYIPGTSHDTVPDFCAFPTISSVRNGAWNDPGSWDAARVPAAGDIVDVRHTIDFAESDARIDCLGIHGLFIVSRTVNTRLTAGTIIVYSGGTLDAGTASSPITARAEIVIADKPLNTTGSLGGRVDPEQFGTGLLGFGTVRMHGRSYASTFMRLQQELGIGSGSILLSQPVDWLVGDTLAIPDTRHLTDPERGTPGSATRANFIPQTELRTIASISGDGRTVTLNTPTQYRHRGARTLSGQLVYLPHVMNLSRNVIIRSENPSGTRGHVLFTNRANVDIRYTAFQSLGRTRNIPLNNTVITGGAVQSVGTNQIGRYALHMHHLYGPLTPQSNGHQFTLIGNAIHQDAGDTVSTTRDWKWGIAVHGSHYGLLMDNVVYNVFGAGIAFEDGSESFNVVDHNFVMRVNGSGDRGDGRGGVGSTDLAHDGVGFWFRGTNNYVRNNVAATFHNPGPDSAYGFKYFSQGAGNVKIPVYQGANTTMTGQFRTVPVHMVPLLEFDNNESYGGQSGLTMWWMGAYNGDKANVSKRWNVFKNTKIWHIYNRGVFQYEVGNVLFDGYTQIGANITNSACCSKGYTASDYPAINVVMRNANIQGMQGGVEFSHVANKGLFVLENSYLRNRMNVFQETLWSVAANSLNMGARKTIVRNVRFGGSVPGTAAPTNIEMRFNSPGYTPPAMPPDSRNVIEKDEMCVYNYNMIAGAHLQLYYKKQAPSATIEQRFVDTNGIIRRNACPSAGMTNAQCWAQHGVATAGSLATCADDTTYPTLTGYSCSLSAACPAAYATQSFSPPIVYAPRVTNVTMQGASIDWKSDVAATVAVRYAPGIDVTPTQQTSTQTGMNGSINLTGLMPDTVYTFQVVALSGTGGVLTDTYPFTLKTASALGGSQSPSSSSSSVSSAASSQSSAVSSIASSSAPPAAPKSLCALLRLERRIASGNHALASVNVIIKSQTGLVLLNTNPNPSLSSTGMLAISAAQLSRVRDDTTTQYTIEVRPNGHLMKSTVRTGILGACFDLGIATVGDFDGTNSISINDIVRLIAFYNGNTDASLSDVYRSAVGIADIVAVIVNYRTGLGL